MRRLITAAKRRPALTLAVIVGVLAVLVGGMAAVTTYTSRPAFCTSCHEMNPYYAAWDQGSHSGTSCVSCHVDSGAKAQITHKFVALKEVYDHFTADPKFPGAVTDVPDRRCVACHKGTIDTGIAGFSHEKHRGDRSCVDCHTNAGHSVTAAALAEAGILDSAAMQARVLLKVAARGSGVANVTGHPTVACTSCHDLAKTGCASCHDRDAKTHPVSASVSATATGQGTDCATCHDPSLAWQFSHPAATATCTSCHTRPAKHSDKTCATCHTTDVSWKFVHPSSATTCTSCHARPAKHSTKTCVSCHKTGVSWSFSHPSSKDCTSCHTRPSKHYSGACASCHSPRVAFAKATFKHPGSGATCTNCHSRPAGHSAKTCSSCHKTGVSWRFSHPSSKSCASCHKAPSSHFGTSCASCHTPSRAWRSATFSHPQLQEHTYRSFACVKCHPRGYSSATCTACHGAGGPGD